MKKVFIINLLIFIILTMCLNISYASVPVTEENLEKSLQSFMEKKLLDYTSVSLDKTNKQFIISSETDIFKLNYDLSNQPKFTFEIPIEKGISYDEFKTQTDNLYAIPMLGYIAVANMQGISFEDASAYFLFSYLDSISDSFSTDNGIWIYDDTKLSDGVTIDKSSGSSNTIYVSEFGEKVMEYVNATYKDSIRIKDNKDSDISSYSLLIEKRDVTDTSCKLISEIVVDTEADFLKLNGLSKSMSDSFLGGDINKENADMLITLKVGQKCKFQTTESISGYASAGDNCIEFNDDNTVISAIAPGTRRGYLNIGDSKKTFYITVEENTENKTLKDMIFKIPSTSSTTNTINDNNKNNIINNTTNNTSNTTNNTQESLNKNKLPQTGDFFDLKDGLVLLIIAATIFLTFIVIKDIKYKNINK